VFDFWKTRAQDIDSFSGYFYPRDGSR
jgi:hypothetical protein